MAAKKNLSRIIMLSAVICLLSISGAFSQSLTVPQVYQEQTNWCWAAASKAILDYKGTVLRQCDIVNWVRVQKGWGAADCCDSVGASVPACNNGNYLYMGTGCCMDVLANWGVNYTGFNGALNRAQVTTQMGLLNPIMIRYDWWGGGAHALILHGFTAGTDMANIMDPWYGPYVADFDWVLSGSSPGHDWTRSLAGGAPQANGFDVVYIVDVTGSTSELRPEYKQAIQIATNIFEANAPASRYALTYLMDFPLLNYGDPADGDIAYAVQTDFVANLAALQPFLNSLPNGDGKDEPESQYTAVFQAITGTGLDLDRDGNYENADGDIPPSPLSYLPNNVRAYYLFTYPVQFHNSDNETNYPILHSLPPPFTECADSACSRFLTLNAVSNLQINGMLMGFTITSVPKGSFNNQQMPAEPIAANESGRQLTANKNLYEVNSLEELARASGGTVFELTSENVEQVAQASYNWVYNSLSMSVPTLSEWGLIIFSLLILTLVTVVVVRRRLAVSGAGTGTISTGVTGPLFFPSLFMKAIVVTCATATIVLVIATVLSDSVPVRDIVGTMISAAIVAYIAHLWLASAKE